MTQPSASSAQAILLQPTRLQECSQLLRRPRDDRSIALYDDRTLHQLGIFEQQLNDLRRLDVVTRFEAQFAEPFVDAHQISGRPLQYRNDFLQRFARRRSFEILDGVELDTPLAQQLQRAA